MKKKKRGERKEKGIRTLTVVGDFYHRSDSESQRDFRGFDAFRQREKERGRERKAVDSAMGLLTKTWSEIKHMQTRRVRAIIPSLRLRRKGCWG